MLRRAIGLALALGIGLSPLFAQERRVQPGPGSGRRRMALVVGNASYASSPLRNAANDAQAFATALRQLGFDVQMAVNADLQSLDRAVNGFVASVHAGDIALFYYSGHGVQVEGENYLVPTDFHAEQEADVPYQAYAAARVHERMQASGASLSILILDACRDNPFRTGRSGSKGLAPMNTGKGSFIAFATAPGTTASDNPAETNGLFTKYLLEMVQQPDLKLDEVFNQVREQVYTASKGKQLPWTASSVIGTFVFRDLAAEEQALAAERARLETELKELERQVTEAQRRNEAQEQAEKEKEAAALRARVDFERQEQERLRQERERQKAAQAEAEAGAERGRRQKEEETKLAELRSQRDEEQLRLQLLAKQTVTLAEAQQVSAGITLHDARLQLAALRSKVRDIELRLKTEYTAVNEEPQAPKGTFETTAEYSARIAKQKERQAQAVQRYAADLSSFTAIYKSQIAELLSRNYPAEPKQRLNLKLAVYDADRQVMFATFSGFNYRFSVDRNKAKSLYANGNKLMVEGSFLQAEEDRLSAPNTLTLIDLGSMQTISSNWSGVDVTGAWTATAHLPGSCRGAKGEKEVTLKFDLRLEGDKLNGSAVERCSLFFYGADHGYKLERSIADGKINGDTIIFTLEKRKRSRTSVAEIRFVGKASMRQISFTVAGGQFTAKKQN